MARSAKIALLIGGLVGMAASSGEAQTLDTVVFGDGASETAHAVTAPFTQAITGGIGQPARKIFSDPADTTNSEGGYIEFSAKCDPIADNFVTLKLWGSDKGGNSGGTIHLYQMENGVMYGVNYRDVQASDTAPLAWTTGVAAIPNRFYYTTIPLPLSMTQGRTSVTLRVIGSGVGTLGSPGIYRAYVHLGSYFQPGAGDPQGTQPAPAPIQPTTGGDFQAAYDRARAATIANMNIWLANGGGDYNQLLTGYNVPWCPAYQNPLVPPRVVANIDSTCQAYFANPGSAGGDWGGSYGDQGDMIRQIGAAGFGSALDQVVNLGDPAGPATRRVLWSKMLKASRDVGQFARRGPTTNQSLISDKAFYNANKGLLVLNSPDALTDAHAKRFLLESVGLLPWMGADNADGTPQGFMGSDYYIVTPSGLTKENGYVSAYGEVYDTTMDYLRSSGDPIFATRGVEMLRARSYFRYPMVDEEGYRSFRMIGPLDWRKHQDFPFDEAYGERNGRLSIAPGTRDPYAIGLMWQQFNDGKGSTVFGTDIGSALFLEMLLEEPDSGQRLPMTEGQPDYAWCDVDNGIVAIKRGEELTWIETYWQARSGIHSMGRAMQITPTDAHVSHIRINTQFDWNGAWDIQPDSVQWSGVPFNSYLGIVHGAYANQHILQAKAPATAGGAAGREEYIGRAQFYTARYGRYLVGINMDKTKSFVLKTPPGFTSAQDLITKTTKSGTVTVGPVSAVVLDMGTTIDTAPLPINPRYISAQGVQGGISVYWDTAGGANTYTLQRATTPGGPYTTLVSGVGATYPKTWGQWPNCTYVDATAASGTTYYYRAYGSNANGDGYPTCESVGATPLSIASVNALPAPWANVNFSAGGSASYNAGTGAFTVTGGGGDLYNTSDGGHFVYHPIAGDGALVARLVSTAGAYKCGLAIRETLAANSRHVTLMYQNGGLGGMWREVTGGSTKYVLGSAAGNPAPVWMKLERVGRTMFLSWAPDNAGVPGAWINYSQQGIDIGANAYIGLYTTSGSPVFDHVTPPPYGNRVPSVPATFTAIGGNGQIALAWSAANQASSYTVKRAATSGGPYNVTVASNLTALSYTNNGLSNGTTFYYVVSATNATGESANSAQAGATTSATALPPGNLTVATTGTQAVLNWNASSGATSYTVRRSLDGVTWTTVASGVTGTTYTNTGLTNGQSYLYSVVAVNGSGSSAGTTSVATTTAPLASELIDAAGTYTQALLKWTPVAGAASYRVKRASTSGGTYATVASNLTNPSYTDNGLTNGADYFYVVTAVNAAGESAASPEMKLGWGTGLLGQYYNSNNFSGGPVLVRIDPIVNFNWGAGSPDPIVNADNFSVRWTGKFEAPKTGTYTFTAGQADDSFYLSINGISIAAYGSATTSLVAGQKYDIVIEFRDIGGAALFSFSYGIGNGPLESLPTSRLYFNPDSINRAGGGIATASSGSGTEGPAKAFDGSNASKWNNAVPGLTAWLQYQFPGSAAWAVNEYRLTSANDAQGRDPKDWQLLGSNDGTNWTPLDTQTGQVFTARLQTKSYPIASPAAFAYYRLNITANFGGASNSIQLAELALFAPPSFPPAPATLTVTPGNAQATLNWSAVVGASKYTVKRSSYPNGPFAVEATVTSGTSYIDTNLANGFTYYYVVSAITPAGASENSQPVGVLVLPVPAAPAGLTATPGSNQASLQWNAVPWATSYTLKRSTTSGSGYANIASGLAGTSYTDSGLPGATTYYYVVTATNGTGTSGNSAQASATVAATPAVFTGTSGASVNEQPIKAFDGLTATKYCIGSSTGFVQVQFENGLSKTIASYAVISANDVPGRDPKDWQLQGSSNGTTWTTLDTRTAQAFTARFQTKLYPIASPAAFAYYRFNVTANAGGSGVGLQFSELALIPSLPSPWATADIGSVGSPGTGGSSNGVFTAVGSGANIFGTADSFRYVYQTASGDCSITARVTNIQNTNGSAKAGVMIRETLNADSIQATSAITPGGLNEAISRLGTGSSSVTVSAAGAAAPYWVRLVRSGNTFTSARSADGVNWVTTKTETVTMATNVYIGLPVCSLVNGTLMLVGFDNVTAVP